MTITPELASQLESDRADRVASAAESAAMHDSHRAELTNLKSELQSMRAADREDFESKHTERDQTMGERFSALEARLDSIEPRVDANILGLQLLGNDLGENILAMDKKLQETQNEFTQQCQSIIDVQLKLSQNIEALEVRCDRQKDECMNECQAVRGQLDDTMTSRYEGLTTLCSQTSKTVQGIKKEHDNSLHDMQVRVDQLYTNLVEERNNHARWMDEERTAFRKVHDEHMHIVEKERDARLRQMQELRTDMSKVMRDPSETEGARLRPLGLAFKGASALGSSTSTIGSSGSSTVSTTSGNSTTALPTKLGSGTSPTAPLTKLGSIISNLKTQKLQE